VFLTHLHSDHLADLATLYVAAKYGRTTPLEVWGPSGEAADMGTAAAVQGLRQVGGASVTHIQCTTGSTTDEKCLH